MTDDGFGPAFRRARHHLPRADWELLHGMTEPDCDMYQQALAALPNVSLDAPDDRLTASLRSIDAAGHTPGHRALVVESGGRTFCFLGDLVHVPELHFAEPERVTAWDAMPELTPPSRRRLATAAVTGDWLLAATHASPALGRLTPAGPTTGSGERPISVAARYGSVAAGGAAEKKTSNVRSSAIVWKR